jgi:methyltransferase
VGLVVLQRLGELLYARHNTRRLLAAGGREIGAAHYPLIIALHGAWLLSLLLLVPADRPPAWPLLLLFLALQVVRLWILVSLGRFWTTRIITLPGSPLVRRGPYRYLRHPNYLLVSAEIALLPMVFGAWPIALAFTLANAALLAYRIRVEDTALAPRRGR